MTIQDDVRARKGRPETDADADLPLTPEDDDPELEPFDGEAVVVPGQRPGPTEPLPM